MRLARRALSSAAKGASRQSLVPHIGLDIGGSLTKLVIRSDHRLDVDPAARRFIARVLDRLPRHPGWEPHLGFQHSDGFRYSFLKFETRWMSDFLRVMQELQLPPEALPVLSTTGGGAFKFSSDFASDMGIQLQPVDEMESTVSGLRWFENIPGEVRWCDLHDDDPGKMKPWPPPPPVTSDGSEAPSTGPDPRLLVSIGSGVSVIRVGEEGQQRVNGCSIGGATFWGLCRLMTRFRSFEDAIRAAEFGDNDRVAMLVKDIYGQGYESLGLPGDVVASDFGRIATRDSPRQGHAAGVVASDSPNFGLLDAAAAMGIPAEPEVTDADLARALIVLVLNNIAQVAFMTAMEHGARQVYFSGSFLRSGVMARVLTSALHFWSQGQLTAAFLRHDKYFGAMGALLHAPQAQDK